MKTITLPALLFIFAAGTLAAQNVSVPELPLPPDVGQSNASMVAPRPNEARTVFSVALSQEQMAKLQQLDQEFLRSFAPLLETLKSAREALASTLRDSPHDAVAVQDKTAAFENAKTSIQIKEALHKASVDAVFTSAQRAAINK